MSSDADPSVRTPRRLTAALAAALGGLCVLAIYGYASFVLSGDADLMRCSSGIFDMDVSRVVVDLTSERAAFRTSVHPLQKLFVAPLGEALNARIFGGRHPLHAVRVLIAMGMTLQTLAVGVLAYQLGRRSLSAGIAAGLVCAFSFSSVLAATIPESAAVSCLSTTLPLIFLNARWGRTFSWWEAAGWGVLGVFCVGLTLTQLVHWGIALGVRLSVAREAVGETAAASASPRLPRLALCLLLFVALTWLGIRLQAHLYPGTEPFDAGKAVRNELPFMRTGMLLGAPLFHVTRLIGHFLLFDFVAPFPGYSDFLVRDFGIEYWSLSIEEAGLAEWAPAQLLLGAAVLAAVLAAGASLRRAGAMFVAPLLTVASQFGMHLFYGREYVLYSPHWHGVLAAVLVASAWNRAGRRRLAAMAAAAVLSLAMLANSLAVMKVVYAEVEAGLELSARGPSGAARDPALRTR